MAFLRRGNIKFPHKGNASVTLHRIDGQPIFIRLGDVSCWEEHVLAKSLAKIVMLYHGLSSTAVRESFDEVSAIVNGKAVQP